MTELPLLSRRPEQRGRTWEEWEAGASRWRCGASARPRAADTAAPAHAMPSPGWQFRQHRLGGLALFTPSAACTGLFKQSGCLHKLPRCPWTSSGRRVLMWPFPGAPRTVCSGVREGGRCCQLQTTAPVVPVVWPDNCRPKKMVEQHQNLGSLGAPWLIFGCWSRTLKPTIQHFSTPQYCQLFLWSLQTHSVTCCLFVTGDPHWNQAES